MSFGVRVEHHNGPRYFVRFSRQVPTLRLIVIPSWRDAYCFATQEDAQRVVDQLGRLGRRAWVVTERRKPSAARASTSPIPPAHLQPWVVSIIRTGRASAGPHAGDLSVINCGYRELARHYHPDRGGQTTDMQHLNGARDWLHQNRARL